jgi:hypothetical protein
VIDITEYVRDADCQTVKLREHPKALDTKRRRKLWRGQVNALGYGKNLRDDGSVVEPKMGNPQPSPTGPSGPMDAVHRLNGGRWASVPA